MEWGRDDKLNAFCSGYNVPILFQNLQNLSLICMKQDTLSNQ